MFQNISGQVDEEDYENEVIEELNNKFDLKQFIKYAFTKQKILVCCLQ